MSAISSLLLLLRCSNQNVHGHSCNHSYPNVHVVLQEKKWLPFRMTRREGGHGTRRVDL